MSRQSSLSLAVVVLVVLAAYSDGFPQRRAPSLDRINVDEVLRSDRLLAPYIRCLLQNGKCTPEGNELKKLLPDALSTSCLSCTPKQRSNAIKIIGHLSLHKPDVWRQLKAKYDPREQHLKKLRLLIKPQLR